MGKDKFCWDFSKDVVFDTDRDALLLAAWALIHDKHPSAQALAPLTKYLTACAANEVRYHRSASEDEMDLVNKSIEAVLERRAAFAAFETREALLDAIVNMYWHVVKERRAEFQRSLRNGLCDSYQSPRDVADMAIVRNDDDRSRAFNDDYDEDAAPADTYDARFNAALRAMRAFCREEWPDGWRIETAVAASVMRVLPDVPGRKIARAFCLTDREERAARTTQPIEVPTRSVYAVSQLTLAQWCAALWDVLRSPDSK